MFGFVSNLLQLKPTSGDAASNVSCDVQYVLILIVDQHPMCHVMISRC
jgi:hypothetical protein